MPTLSPAALAGRRFYSPRANGESVEGGQHHDLDPVVGGNLDRARGKLDRHANYIVVDFIEGSG